ncbi:hypothetical protein CEY02_19750 [Bacillus pumilus]|uniref:Uncharacterized protein n=1 Tax=Bacillus pumilus TaxID=1408 RepID=A0A2A5IK01_BACPU|nr:pyocin knob domain-containing protein [Bacillus pumilus]PCK17670.1 hypothetical protein CEY02_19750 [Bacillus pumilus]
MLDSNIRGLFKKIEYQIANLKGLFSKNEKQMLDNINDFKKDNEEFKDTQKYVLSVHMNDQNNPHKVTKNQIGLDKVDNLKQASEVEFLAHKNDTNLHVTEVKQKSWDAKETTTGSQSKADVALSAAKKYTDEHANNKEIHVIQSDKDKWNNGQLYRLTQNNGKPIYKGTSETTDYNEITDTGFYLIFNKGVNGPPSTNASFMIVISYTSTLLQTVYEKAGRKSYYRIKKTDSTWTEWTRVLTEEDKVTEAEKDKWNNGQLYKLTTDSGTSQLLPNGTDILTLPSGYYYAVGTNVVNMPSKTDSSWFNIYVMDNSNNRKTFHVIRSADNKHWWGTVHTDGSFRGWERMLTDTNANVAWSTPSLSNGWKQYVSPDGYPHTLRYSKDALGVVEIIGSIYGGTLGNDVTAFTLPAGYRPLQSTHLIGVASSLGTSGVPQYHRTYIGTDGRVCIQSCSNTSNPAEFITFGFRFKSA